MVYSASVAPSIAVALRSHWYWNVGLPLHSPWEQVSTVPTGTASNALVTSGSAVETGGVTAGSGETSSAVVGKLVAPCELLPVTTHWIVLPSSSAISV